MFECVGGLRPQLQGTVYLLFAIIAFYSIGSHWDVFILQPFPLHSCLTYFVFLLQTPPPHTPRQTVSSPTFEYAPPHSRKQLNQPSQVNSTRLMCS